MTIPPIDPSLAGLGSEWQIPGIGSPTQLAPAQGTGATGAVDGVAATGGSGSSFGSALAEQIGNLTELQESAASASQSLANGTATDIASVVTSVEKAQLAMQLAGQIRTKGSEAINDIFHTQI